MIRNGLIGFFMSAFIATVIAGRVNAETASVTLAPRAASSRISGSAPADMYPETQPKVARIERYLNNHPETARQLHRNPTQINDQKFLKSHPQLADFLTTHREFAQQVKRYPGSFMQRVRWYHRGQGAIDSKAKAP